MSSFTTPLRLEYIDGRKWKLHDPFEYHVGSKDSNFVIRVPAGFITDFASIPRVFWRLLPPTGKYGKAAVIHDYLYDRQRYGRELSDTIFLEAMQVLRVNWLTRQVMYAGVRLFGWIPWNKKVPIEKP